MSSGRQSIQLLRTMYYGSKVLSKMSYILDRLTQIRCLKALAELCIKKPYLRDSFLRADYMDLEEEFLMVEIILSVGTRMVKDMVLAKQHFQMALIILDLDLMINLRVIISKCSLMMIRK